MTPLFASLSKAGVCMSGLFQDTSLKPRSSANSTRKFGDPVTWWTRRRSSRMASVVSEIVFYVGGSMEGHQTGLASQQFKESYYREGQPKGRSLIMITVKLCHKVQLILDQKQKHIFSFKTGRLNVQDLSGGSRLSLCNWESRYLATAHINWTFMGRRSEKSVRKLWTFP